MISCALQRGDLYVVDLKHNYFVGLKDDEENDIDRFVQNELCLIVDVKSDFVKFMNPRGKIGWVHRDLFYPPELPGD